MDEPISEIRSLFKKTDHIVNEWAEEQEFDSRNEEMPYFVRYEKTRGDYIGFNWRNEIIKVGVAGPFDENPETVFITFERNGTRVGFFRVKDRGDLLEIKTVLDEFEEKSVEPNLDW